MFQVRDWWRVRGTLSLLHLFCSVNCRWIGVKSVWEFFGIRMVGLHHLENTTRYAMRSRSPVWVHLWLNQCEGILDMQWWTSSPVHPIEMRTAAQRCLCIGSHVSSSWLHVTALYLNSAPWYGLLLCESRPGLILLFQVTWAVDWLLCLHQ